MPQGGPNVLSPPLYTGAGGSVAHANSNSPIQSENPTLSSGANNTGATIAGNTFNYPPAAGVAMSNSPVPLPGYPGTTNHQPPMMGSGHHHQYVMGGFRTQQSHSQPPTYIHSHNTPQPRQQYHHHSPTIDISTTKMSSPFAQTSEGAIMRHAHFNGGAPSYSYSSQRHHNQEKMPSHASVVPSNQTFSEASSPHLINTVSVASAPRAYGDIMSLPMIDTAAATKTLPTPQIGNGNGRVNNNPRNPRISSLPGSKPQSITGSFVERSESSASTAGPSNRSGVGAGPSVATTAEDLSLFVQSYRAASEAERVAYFTLDSLLGHVVSFAVDAEGSRGLQRLISEASGLGTTLTRKGTVDMPTIKPPRVSVAPHNLNRLRAVFAEIEPRLQDVIFSTYGNFVVQKFIETQCCEFIVAVASFCKGRAVSMAKDDFGCRILQNLVETQLMDGAAAVVAPHVVALIKELSEPLEDEIYAMIVNQNANHVLQRCMTFFPRETAFVVPPVAARFTELAKHVYGSRVIQCIFEQMKVPHVRPIDEARSLKMMFTALEQFDVLVNTQYGNFAVTHALVNSPAEGTDLSYLSSCAVVKEDAKTEERATESALEGGKKDPEKGANVNSNGYVGAMDTNSAKIVFPFPANEIRKRIVDAILPNIISLSSSKFASNVSQRVFQFSNESQQRAFMNVLLQPQSRAGTPNVVALMMDQYANYVMQDVFIHSNEPQRQELLRCVRPYLAQISRSQFGRHIVGKTIGVMAGLSLGATATGGVGGGISSSNGRFAAPPVNHYHQYPPHHIPQQQQQQQQNQNVTHQSSYHSHNHSHAYHPHQGAPQQPYGGILQPTHSNNTVVLGNSINGGVNPSYPYQQQLNVPAQQQQQQQYSQTQHAIVNGHFPQQQQQQQQQGLRNAFVSANAQQQQQLYFVQQQQQQQQHVYPQPHQGQVGVGPTTTGQPQHHHLLHHQQQQQPSGGGVSSLSHTTHPAVTGGGMGGHPQQYQQQTPSAVAGNQFYNIQPQPQPQPQPQQQGSVLPAYGHTTNSVGVPTAYPAYPFGGGVVPANPSAAIPMATPTNTPMPSSHHHHQHAPPNTFSTLGASTTASPLAAVGGAKTSVANGNLSQQANPTEEIQGLLDSLFASLDAKQQVSVLQHLTHSNANANSGSQTTSLASGANGSIFAQPHTSEKRDVCATDVTNTNNTNANTVSGSHNLNHHDSTSTAFLNAAPTTGISTALGTSLVTGLTASQASTPSSSSSPLVTLNTLGGGMHQSSATATPAASIVGYGGGSSTTSATYGANNSGNVTNSHPFGGGHNSSTASFIASAVVW